MSIKRISLERCKYYFDYTDDGKLIWKHVSENAVNKKKYRVGGSLEALIKELNIMSFGLKIVYTYYIEFYINFIIM